MSTTTLNRVVAPFSAIGACFAGSSESRITAPNTLVGAYQAKPDPPRSPGSPETRITRHIRWHSRRIQSLILVLRPPAEGAHDASGLLTLVPGLRDGGSPGNRSSWGDSVGRTP
jgi:hypothetical protein